MLTSNFHFSQMSTLFFYLLLFSYITFTFLIYHFHFSHLSLSAAVVVSFFVCWAPFHTQRLLHVFIYSYQSDNIYITVYYSILQYILYSDILTSQWYFLSSFLCYAPFLSWNIDVDLAPLFYVTGILLYLRFTFLPNLLLIKIQNFSFLKVFLFLAQQ